MKSVALHGVAGISGGMWETSSPKPQGEPQGEPTVTYALLTLILLLRWKSEMRCLLTYTVSRSEALTLHSRSGQIIAETRPSSLYPLADSDPMYSVYIYMYKHWYVYEILQDNMMQCDLYYIRYAMLHLSISHYMILSYTIFVLYRNMW